jgi:hypothetical protein
MQHSHHFKRRFIVEMLCPPATKCHFSVGDIERVFRYPLPPPKASSHGVLLIKASDAFLYKIWLKWMLPCNPLCPSTARSALPSVSPVCTSARAMPSIGCKANRQNKPTKKIHHLVQHQDKTRTTYICKCFCPASAAWYDCPSGVADVAAEITYY